MEEPNKVEQQPSVEFVKQVEKEIITDERVTPLHNVGNGYVEFNKGLYRTEALRELRPDLFSAKASINGSQSTSKFGTEFPKIASKGEIFVRVDVAPNRVFKFDGSKWIEINKQATISYLDSEYIEYLVDKIAKGEYDIELLSENERSQIEEYLKGNQNS